MAPVGKGCRLERRTRKVYPKSHIMHGCCWLLHVQIINKHVNQYRQDSYLVNVFVNNKTGLHTPAVSSQILTFMHLSIFWPAKQPPSEVTTSVKTNINMLFTKRHNNIHHSYWFLYTGINKTVNQQQLITLFCI